MSNNAQKAFHMAPLQKLTVEPIVDPVERAALRERVKRSARATIELNEEDGVSREQTLVSMLEWCRQLSADDQLAFATELVAQLSPEQQSQLKARLS